MSGVRSAPALLPASGFLKTAPVATRRSGGLARAPYSVLISSTNVTVLRISMGLLLQARWQLSARVFGEIAAFAAVVASTCCLRSACELRLDQHCTVGRVQRAPAGENEHQHRQDDQD